MFIYVILTGLINADFCNEHNVPVLLLTDTVLKSFDVFLTRIWNL